MPPKMKKLLWFSDVHIPYHSKPGVELLLEVAYDWRPEIIVAGGDIWDAYCVSSFSKDPNRETQVDEEIKEVNEFLDELDGVGAKRKVWVNANHEERMERFLSHNAPQLYNMVKIEKLLKLKQRGWEFVPYKDHIKIGHVYFTHDVGNTSRTAAFKALDTFQHSVVTGHTHRMQYVVEGKATGEAMVSMQTGWLGDVNQVDYMHKIAAMKNWATGFGVGYLRDNGLIHLCPVPIVENSCVVDGKLYTVGAK